MIIEAVNSAPETTLEELAQKAAELGPGLFAEFGVYQGYTINRIAKVINRGIFGFDSFEGLPEDWIEGYPQGHFKIDNKPELDDNVILVPGRFEDTLPQFFKNLEYKFRFIHIDCDLYSSTKTVFDNVKYRLANECIIVFDELYGYPGWENHEYKAFVEFLEETKYKWECIGKYSVHQAGFKIYV